MTTKPPPGNPAGEAAQPPATKEELQRRMEDARESISQTVEEIRDTVEDQYVAVKATVSGILDWRERFQADPLLWSVGALSAGFAFGYTLGVAKKGRSRSGGKATALDAFADSLVQEFRRAGTRLPLASLDPHVRALLGFGVSDLLAAIGPEEKAPRASRRAKKKSPARRTIRRARR